MELGTLLGSECPSKWDCFYNYFIECIFQCYEIMKIDHINEDFIADLSDIVTFANNSKQEDSFRPSSKTIDKYTVEIEAADRKETKDLSDLLWDALTNVYFKIECMRQRLKVLVRAFDYCKNGRGNFSAIFENTKSIEGTFITRKCLPDIALSKTDLQTVINTTMVLQDHKKQCIRTNRLVQMRVCYLWTELYSNEKIVNEVDYVTLSDVEYFVGFCKPADVNPRVQDQICTSKRVLNVTLSKTIDDYKRYNSTQVTDTYNSCPTSR